MIGLFRAALLSVALGLWSPAFSPTWSPLIGKAGRHVSRLVGDCGSSLAPIAGALLTCVDFVHNAYYANGAAYPSLTAAGGSGSGCTLSLSGLTCTGAANFVIPAANPAANYVMIVKASNANTSTYTTNAALQSGSASSQLIDFENGAVRETTNGVSSGWQSSGLSGEDAFCEGPGVWYGSALGATPGGAVSVGSANPSANAMLYLGNDNGQYTNGVGAYVQSVRIVSVPTCSATIAAIAATL